MSAAGRARRLAATLRSGRRRLALAWAATGLVALAALAGGPGLARDEAAAIDAARRVAALGRPPADAGAAGEATAAIAAAPPPLLPALSAAAHVASTRLGLSDLRGHRLATVALAALLLALLALLGHELAGPAGALLAPALYLAVPRLLHLALVATPDTALAALALATVWGYRRSSAGPRRRRVRSAALAGVAFGLALAARLDAWILLPLLSVHAAIARALRPRSSARPPPGDRPAAELEARLHGVPLALAAMATLGPLVLLATWPSFWADPLRRLAAAAAAPPPGWEFLGAPLAPGRPPALYPLAVTALALPAGILAAAAGGLLHAASRAIRGIRGEEGVSASDEALLLLAALTPFAATAAGATPLLPGVRPWVVAFPFLALLGARALLAAARLAWPARADALAASLVLVVLWPGIRQAVHAWPHPAAAWGELAGGTPGAASQGLERQDGGEALAAALRDVRERARPGARVLLAGASPAAVRLHGVSGALREDLVPVTDPAEAEIAVVALDGGSRDLEYRIWAEFRSARPVAGILLDEVPLAWVYARPGAWR